MDPDTNLEDQRRIVSRIVEAFDKDRDPNPNDAYRLAELVEALDGWLSKGGFLPKRWER